MKPSQIKITFTADQLREAVAGYEALLKPDIESAYDAMLKVPEFGLKVAQALQQAAKMAGKGKMGADRVLDAAVVPAFLIGMLVNAQRSGMGSYCAFVDTGERRFPKRREWYFYVKAVEAFPVYYGMEIALGYGASDYGILRLVQP